MSAGIFSAWTVSSSPIISISSILSIIMSISIPLSAPVTLVSFSISWIFFMYFPAFVVPRKLLFLPLSIPSLGRYMTFAALLKLHPKFLSIQFHSVDNAENVACSLIVFEFHEGIEEIMVEILPAVKPDDLLVLLDEFSQSIDDLLRAVGGRDVGEEQLAIELRGESGLLL